MPLINKPTHCVNSCHGMSSTKIYIIFTFLTQLSKNFCFQESKHILIITTCLILKISSSSFLIILTESISCQSECQKDFICLYICFGAPGESRPVLHSCKSTTFPYRKLILFVYFCVHYSAFAQHFIRSLIFF